MDDVISLFDKHPCQPLARVLLEARAPYYVGVTALLACLKDWERAKECASKASLEEINGCLAEVAGTPVLTPGKAAEKAGLKGYEPVLEGLAAARGRITSAEDGVVEVDFGCGRVFVKNAEGVVEAMGDAGLLTGRGVVDRVDAAGTGAFAVVCRKPPRYLTRERTSETIRALTVEPW